MNNYTAFLSENKTVQLPAGNASIARVKALAYAESKGLRLYKVV